MLEAFRKRMFRGTSKQELVRVLLLHPLATDSRKCWMQSIATRGPIAINFAGEKPRTINTEQLTVEC